MDPITANGVTAALRHAEEACGLILKYGKRSKLPLGAGISYNSRIAQLADFFNSGVEDLVYQPQVRNRLGMGGAAGTSISPAWVVNAFYARSKPNGLFSTMLLGFLMEFPRACQWILYRCCKLFSPSSAKATYPNLVVKGCCMHLFSSGSGYPVLFIHGMPTSGRLWDGVVSKLRGRFHCLAVDLPGLGKSPKIPYGPTQLAILFFQPPAAA